jgi:hypothetical protein
MSGIEKISLHDDKCLTQRSVPIHKILLVTNNEKKRQISKIKVDGRKGNLIRECGVKFYRVHLIQPRSKALLNSFRNVAFEGIR